MHSLQTACLSGGRSQLIKLWVWGLIYLNQYTPLQASFLVFFFFFNLVWVFFCFLGQIYTTLIILTLIKDIHNTIIEILKGFTIKW